MGSTMVSTGERMVPEESDQPTFWEHIGRYRFACRFVRGKRVADVACGEGYGSRVLLAAGATFVASADLRGEVCRRAQKKYGLTMVTADAHRLPWASRSLDVVVSFETLEHLADPRGFLDECCRVLADDGPLVISTPNRDAFRKRSPGNPFHCAEMSEEEFLEELNGRYRSVSLYSQGVLSAHWWSLRSMLAIQSPWVNLRGFFRLRGMLCPHLATMRDGEEVSAEHRFDPVEAARCARGRLGGIMNPYLVRRRSRLSGEVPLFLVAVARRKR